MNRRNNHTWTHPRREQSMYATEGGLIVKESESAGEGSHCSTRKLSLLLVDDDPALLNALSDTIAFHLGPLTLHASDSGIQALDLVRVHAYDAMIVDVNMPNMNGLEFLALVKQLRPNIPVLLMSAHADDGLMARAFEAGASHFIAKPFDRDNFISAVRQGLELSPHPIAIKHDERQLIHTTQAAAMPV